MMSRIYIVILFSFLCLTLFGQTPYRLSGVVRSSEGNALADVSLFVYEEKGTVSDTAGHFSLLIESGLIRLSVSHTQYIPRVFYINLRADTFLTIVLDEDVKQIEEVVVRANSRNFLDNVIPGMISIRQEELSLQPQLFGVPDVVSAIQRGAGVQSVSEGIAGIYVRGGNAGQNLIVYDHIELLDPSHLLGTFSAFNPYLTEGVDLYKGNAPVEYAGKLSSSIIVNSYSACDD